MIMTHTSMSIPHAVGSHMQAIGFTELEVDAYTFLLIEAPATDLGTVLHGTWSESAFLSHLYHSGLVGEMSTSAIRTAVDAGATRKELRDILDSLSRLEHIDTQAFAGLTAESRLGLSRGTRSQAQRAAERRSS